MSFKDEDTVADIPVYIAEPPIVATGVEEPGIEIAALTHQGRVRAKNEDQYAVMRRTRSGAVLASSLPDADRHIGGDQHAWLMAVADGLGGHSSGEVASAIAIQTILNFANGLASWIMRPGDGSIRDDMAERVELYSKAIQKEMKSQAADSPDLAGMATTVTAAYVFDANVVVINVGDSRSYLLHGNEIRQITRDHTLAQHMKDGGLAHEHTSRFRNLLTRTFSADDRSVDVDMFQLRLDPGDRILLCSDGLTDMLADEAILNIVKMAPSAKEACEQLVLAALNNGGRDNVTTVLARVH